MRKNHGGGGGGWSKKKAAPLKGCVTIRVGREEEEIQSFVVPVEYVNHPLFAWLLKMAEEEYGFENAGPIRIPCYVEVFRRVQAAINLENSGHLRFANCFKA